MAKKLAIKSVAIKGTMANQEFPQLRIQTQVGDKFFVPKADQLLVLSIALPLLGNERPNEKGEITPRLVGQHFPAVRIVDGKPTEVVELYVGQLVKVDINRALVFPGTLADALRKGSDSFKQVICGRMLSVTEEKTIKDRVWVNADPENGVEAGWLREEDGKTFASADKRALKFEPVASNMSAADTNTAYEMLEAFYADRYADHLEA